MTDPVVLVPLDGSKDALCALPVARRLAELEKASVRILHVADPTRPPGETAQSLDLQGATLELRTGNPADAIAAASAEATLIVMSAPAADVRPAEAIDAGTLAVLRRAQRPVVLVNPAHAPSSEALRRVLVPHDGSPAVSNALAPATRLVREAGAELIVLQVACDARAQETGSIAPPAYLDQVQHGWPLWSGEFLQRLGSVCPLADMRVRLLVAHGEPAAETIRVAVEQSADLIVLAWKGRWEAPHASTLRALLQGAPCPIMVTRVPAAAP